MPKSARTPRVKICDPCPEAAARAEATMQDQDARQEAWQCARKGLEVGCAHDRELRAPWQGQEAGSAWPGLGVTSRNTTDVTPTPGGPPRPPTLLATLARLPSCFLTRAFPIHSPALKVAPGLGAFFEGKR